MTLRQLVLEAGVPEPAHRARPPRDPTCAYLRFATSTRMSSVFLSRETDIR